MSAKKRLERHRKAAAAQPVKPDKDEIITFRGWKMTRYTAAAIKVYEEKLGYELTIVQGPFNTGVSQSAGTHDEDGVIDLAPYRSKQKCKVGRRNSWAIWIRPENWDGRGGGAHLHGVLLRADVAPLAQKQRDVDYPNHTNGLASEAHDGFPFHPVLERFDYNAWWHDQLLDSQIKGVTATINKLLDRLSGARAKRKRLQQRRAH